MNFPSWTLMGRVVASIGVDNLTLNDILTIKRVILEYETSVAGLGEYKRREVNHNDDEIILRRLKVEGFNVPQEFFDKRAGIEPYIEQLKKDGCTKSAISLRAEQSRVRMGHRGRKEGD